MISIDTVKTILIKKDEPRTLDSINRPVLFSDGTFGMQYGVRLLKVRGAEYVEEFDEKTWRNYETSEIVRIEFEGE